jgi:hypothetical protein
MNSYNPLSSAQRLEAAGLSRKQAEAIAGELADGTNEFVTKDQLLAALDKQTIKIGIMMSAIIALACSIMGVVLSLK